MQFNVFEKETLIIPIFWRKLQHWLLAVVIFAKAKIRVYDSLRQITTAPKNRIAAIHGRVLEMLTWEHRQLYHTPLPDAWRIRESNAVVSVFTAPTEVC